MKHNKIKHQKSLSQFKEKSNKNKTNVKDSLESVQSLRRLSLNPQYNKMKMSKQKLAMYFQRDLDQKIFVDEKVKLKIYNQEKEKLLRKIKIEDTLKQINKKNQEWIKKMNQFKKKMFNKKKQFQFQRDKKQEESLLKQYNSVIQEKNKLAATKVYLSLIQKHDWNQIQIEKSKISQQIKKNIKKQFNIIKDKSPQFLSIMKAKKLKQIKSQQALPVVVQRKKKNQSQRKAIGNQYLQQAKKLMHENVKSKIILMDVNLKNIDYRAQIKQLVEQKSQNLSKSIQLNIDQQNSQQKNKSKNQK